MSKDNLKLWESVQETDPNHTKQVTYGNKFTSINATYQIKNATQAFGMYGDTWGIKSIDYEFFDVVDGQSMVLAKAIFKYPSNGEEVTFPISSTIFMQEYSKKWKCVQADDEWAKKIETDITTKALSKLGFNADVFMGMYDDNKYINSMKEKYKDTKHPTPPKTEEPPANTKPMFTAANFKKAHEADATIDQIKTKYTIQSQVEAAYKKYCEVRVRL